MKCKKCGNELMEGWTICPFCGTEVETKHVCANCGNELMDGWTICPFCGAQAVASQNSASVILPGMDDDLVSEDIAEALQRQKDEANAQYKKQLTLARVACIRRNYQDAQNIYESLLANNPEDVQAYIGFVRIASQNYSVLEGAEIEEAISVAQKVTGETDLTKYDADFAKFVAARKAQREAIAEQKRKAKEEAERKAKLEAERKAKEEAERKAKAEAERKAKEEAERKAKLEAERKAKEEAERKAKAEAERKRLEAERKAKEEAERKAREEAERLAKLEAERKAKEEAERKRKAAVERKRREEAARKRKEEAERIAAEKAREDKYQGAVADYKTAQEMLANKGDVEQQYYVLKGVVTACAELGDYKDAARYKVDAQKLANTLEGKVEKIERKRARKIRARVTRTVRLVYLVEILLLVVDFFLLTGAHMHTWWYSVVIAGLDVVAHIVLYHTVVKNSRAHFNRQFTLTFFLFFVYVIVAVCAVPPIGHTTVWFDHSESGGIRILWNVLITVAEIVGLGAFKFFSVGIGLEIK